MRRIRHDPVAELLWEEENRRLLVASSESRGFDMITMERIQHWQSLTDSLVRALVRSEATARNDIDMERRFFVEYIEDLVRLLAAPRVVQRSVSVVTLLTCGASCDGFEMVNDYVLLGEVGRGRFGRVVAAVHDKTGEMRAIKIIDRRHSKATDADSCGSPFSSGRPASFRTGQNFTSVSTFGRPAQSEIAIMKKLWHPNIVTLYEVIDDPSCDRLYLVMDLINGGSVATISSLGECSRVFQNQDELERYFWQVVDGISYLHECSIVHRDIKPENLLWEPSKRQMLITDFGVSEVASTLTIKSGGAGTPFFIAPENFGDDLDILGAPTDVWALGVTFYSLLVGRVPFFGQTTFALARSILNDPITFPPHVNQRWKLLLSSMLQRNPAERCTLADLQTAISRPTIAVPGLTVSEPTAEEIANAVVERANCTMSLRSSVSAHHSPTSTADRTELSLLRSAGISERQPRTPFDVQNSA